ncbi:MAG: DUF4139 domain-containing protein [Fimbriimonadaceae bacterium]
MNPTFVLGLALMQPAAPAAPSANELTIYNQGFALVKEVRLLDVRTGRQTIAVEDVAEQIETNSVGIRSLTNPQGFVVLEQNYRYDLISPIAILNKAVGGRVRLNRVLPNGVKETIQGTLISAPTAVVGDASGGNQTTFNGMVVRTDDGRILLNPTGEVEVASIPEGLISKPTLFWDVEGAANVRHTVELSYLTRGMNWSADYVLTLDGTGSGADLRGWVTITNNSGATFTNATLKLLAGDVQRAPEPRVMSRGGIAAPAPMMMERAFEQEALFEYHLYTLQRPATVRNREIKQLSLLEGTGIKTEKRLIVDSLRDVGVFYPSEGEVGTGPIKPMVRVEFTNTRENGLGMPLPMGTVKVYQRDRSGSVQMLGEDRIGHTPRDEKISLFVGRSFDVVAERRRTNFRRISPRQTEQSFEIELRNRKETPERVTVLERHYGDWRIVASSIPGRKLDATTQEFVVDLKAGETVKIAYTVETRW